MSAIAGSLAAVAVAVAFGMARRYLPASVPLIFSNAEAAQFASLQWRVGAGMLAAGITFGLLTYLFLLRANQVMAYRAPDSRFVLLPGHFQWMVLPALGGLALS